MTSLCFSLTLFLWWVCLFNFTLSVPYLDPALMRTLRLEKSANILISFKQGTSTSLQSISTQRYASRTHRIRTVAHTLRLNAQLSQGNLLEYLQLSNPPLQFESFWISNQIFIKNATIELIQNLKTFDELSEIYEEEFLELDIPLEMKVHKISHLNKNNSEGGIEWNLKLIEVPEAWEAGYYGQDVIVANIDSGVRYTHRSLRENYVGDYGWYDPYSETPLPNDPIGHGTHTMGIMIGSPGHGVAPRSLWMACKGCLYDLCSSAHLIKCGQFMTCPTRPDFTEPDCSKAPHVINCSWGGGRNNQLYHPVINAWRAAGITSVFSNGNTGPECNTARSPADHPFVIAVGATTEEDIVESYSGLGPTANNTIKPDFVAPGTGVRSSYHTGDDDYAEMRGTSMAAPHVTGTIAILKSRNPNLDFIEIFEHLRKGADEDVRPPGKNCGGIDESQFPNHAVGYGRVNTKKTLDSLMSKDIKNYLNFF